MRDHPIAATGAIKQFPRIALATLPTPLDDAPRLALELGVRRLLVKRDDLTGLGLGGNKVRKLEFLLGDARARGADTIITTAGLQSNFLRLTAAATARVGMKAILLVRGAPDAPLAGNLLLMRLFGADVRFLQTDDPYAESTFVRMREIEDEVRRRGGCPYPIHLGTFSGPLSAVGYVHGAAELAGQIRGMRERCEHVVLAVGSGGTHAGLLLGLRMAGLSCHVLGVSVNAPAEEHRRRIIEKMRHAAELLGSSVSVPDEEVDVTDGYIGPGYGVPTPAALDAIVQAARAEGILLDPVYTGKGWAGLVDSIRRGVIGLGDAVVFLHTGGAPNAFLYSSAIAEQLSACD
ncbi:MAG TPA: D-cysteine desulfhydrase family protein [bacterium]|nr:D-cysteine desulfhydrase family protein [bacterium]